MPRIQPPKYKKPIPQWIGKTLLVIACCGAVTLGWVFADITGMERGMQYCNNKTSPDAIFDTVETFSGEKGYIIPVECLFLFKKQNKAITDEQVEACDKAYQK